MVWASTASSHTRDRCTAALRSVQSQSCFLTTAPAVGRGTGFRGVHLSPQSPWPALCNGWFRVQRCCSPCSPSIFGIPLFSSTDDLLWWGFFWGGGNPSYLGRRLCMLPLQLAQIRAEVAIARPSLPHNGPLLGCCPPALFWKWLSATRIQWPAEKEGQLSGFSFPVLCGWGHTLFPLFSSSLASVFSLCNHENQVCDFYFFFNRS